MRIVIIEDEKPAARLLVRILEELGYKVEQVLYSVVDAIQWFSKNSEPDLILADVQLSDGVSFDIFDVVEIKCPIVFVTAYDQYALKAFKLNSIDYLLKPIEKEDLKSAINKLHTRGLNTIAGLSEIKNYFQKDNYIKRFVIKLGMQIKLVAIEDVVCVFREDRGIYIHTNEGRSYLLDDSSIENVVETLDPKVFYRVNRKQVVALSFIKEILQLSTSRLKIVLESYKDEVIVSRERVTEFKVWLTNN
ncbi:LytR/AlgR family response regulator transcription factor [Myroides phaeus]|uniref:DNA-binding response regulator, LytR/AlgR family n=1 Tax=Myroides phaeus TaxID=702745 RepID=A0A1G8BLN8_9FLAO|nr:LytTR family DNA-binding domain-containing protein [Myroides phaeus]SDH34117.1 DNA-binding response regulator, LytR/AlgR family [Myroides phaeus]